MNALFTLAEVLAATGGRAENITADRFSSISIDSREIIPGALFVAIKGDRFDGHDFVAAAIANGAAAALVSPAGAHGLGDLPLIVVHDALDGLVDLARAARARSTATIVAVTGSAGKTSTKEAIRAIFSAVGRTHAAIKSFNNHWGVPLMLARMPKDTEFGVFEIGMSAAGEISPLSQLVQPDIAVITSIAPAHLENFVSLEGIARAKAEIFDGLKKDGTAIINADHHFLDLLKTAAARARIRHVISYGFAGTADVRIVDPKATAKGMQAKVGLSEGEQVLNIASSGKHRLANAVAALCVAEVAGIDLQSTLDVLAELAEPEGRGATLRLGPSAKPLTIIDESYNANPASMTAALEVFAGLSVPEGRKILVLGDMLELGAASAELHAALKADVLSAAPQEVFLVGKHMHALMDVLGAAVPVIHADSVDEIAGQVLKSLDYGDAVMVKGSNSVRLNSLVSRIRDQFGTATTAG